ncbi:pilus assembly protein PilM [Candidatus Wolfebacteria bacterium]|nr:pilus assembly protein PilM [Candidatus Wolfebacteria bacterium]
MATIDKLKKIVFEKEKIKLLKKKILSFLRYQKPIAGLALAADGIYAVIFDEKKGGMFGDKNPIESLNVKAVGDGLKKIKEKFGASVSSAVISFPPSFSYLTVFEFPLSAEDSQIEEAMKLASASLPFPENQIYSDWMRLENKNIKNKEAVLEMVRKDLMDPYLEVFEKNKISVVAAENYSWSFGQCLEDGDDITMVVMEQPDIATFSIYDGKFPYFRFDLPKDKFNGKEKYFAAAIHYLKSLIHFVSSDNGKTREIGLIIFLGADELADYLQKNVSEIKIQKGFSLNGELQNVSDIGFLSALGAVKRGLIPRKKDDIVSLLPISTETAYERHRIFSFIDFIQKFSIGFSGFLIIVFIGVIIMIKTFFSGIEDSLKKETALPADVAEIKEKAVIFNKNVSQLLKIQNNNVAWEKFFAEIDKIVSGTGVIISQLSANENGEINFSGTAPTRDSLVKLKDYFADSSVFSAESLPLSLFLNKESIAFSLKIKLKDLNFLSNK